MWIGRKKMIRMLIEAYEKGLEMGVQVKQGGIYEGEPMIIREAERILRGRDDVNEVPEMR